MSEQEINRILEQIQSLVGRIITLETQSIERHSAHREKLEVISENISEMGKKMSLIIENESRFKDEIIQACKEYTNKMVALAIGVPGTILVIIQLLK